MSSKALSGVSGLWALQVRGFPCSSLLGRKDNLLDVELPSPETVSLANAVKDSWPTHQDNRAGGLDPNVLHTTSSSSPADKGRLGVTIRTSCGDTEKKEKEGNEHFVSLLYYLILLSIRFRLSGQIIKILFYVVVSRVKREY